MSKLFTLKEWLTLDDAANHLSNVLGEPVLVTDIYKLSLDGHLKLSVKFINGAPAKKAVLIKSEDVKYRKIAPVGLPPFTEGSGHMSIPMNVESQISRDYWIQEVIPKMLFLSGVWDLAMIGAERANLANIYQKEISGHTVNIPTSVGCYVQKEGVIYQLHVMQERLYKRHEETSHYETSIVKLVTNNSEIKLKPRRPPQYRPATSLDELENVLVVKTKELTRFVQSLENTPQDKVLTNNEKNSLLVLVGALCKEANVDWNRRGIAAALVAMTELIGAPLSDETIRKILKQIDSAIESRTR